MNNVAQEVESDDNETLKKELARAELVISRMADHLLEQTTINGKLRLLLSDNNIDHEL